eukprot:COSAG03_NODE_3669_length_1888_cov_7.520402_3_plen_166_part_00
MLSVMSVLDRDDAASLRRSEAASSWIARSLARAACREREGERVGQRRQSRQRERERHLHVEHAHVPLEVVGLAGGREGLERLVDPVTRFAQRPGDRERHHLPQLEKRDAPARALSVLLGHVAEHGARALLLRVAQRLLHIGLCTTPSAAGGGHAEEAHVGTSATR